MDSVIRVVAMYLFLMIVFRLSGKRTLGEANTFDFLLLLVVSETTQQAMVDDDHSMTNAVLMVLTFLVMNIGFSLWKQRSEWFEKLVDSVPLIIVDEGKLLQARMDKARVDEADIIEAARRQAGLKRMDEIRYAILERSGEITVVPRRNEA
jgi:uncharacterized membrane protein YcaP (DUF421 family)